MTLKIASLEQRFVADVTFVTRSSVCIPARMMKIVVLIMETNVLVKITRITESPKAMSALKWLET